MNAQELNAWLLLLAVSGVGSRRAFALVRRFGSPEAVLGKSLDHLAATGLVNAAQARKIILAAQQCQDQVLQDLELIDQHQVTVVDFKDSRYPAALREIGDPPPLLYMQGQLVPEDVIAVAIVGSRRCSDYGCQLTERLAGGLAALDVTIASGMARGVDALAHQAALRAGGRTVAVLGNGLARCYPPEHETLQAEIAAGGAVLSEFSMRTPPRAGNFPARNRIISGISLGVVVVEAPARSGALITAEKALQQDREVFAVPGPVGSDTSGGTNALIRRGARLVESVQDICEDLGDVINGWRSELGHRQIAWSQVQYEDISVMPAEMAAEGAPAGLAAPGMRQPRSRSARQTSATRSDRAAPTETPAAGPPSVVVALTGEEQQVFNCLGAEPRHIDALTRQTGIDVGILGRILLQLELKQIARRLPGNHYQVCS